MPEGHTLHRLAGHLTEAFAGRPVRVSSPQGRFADGAALVDGQVLAGAGAWGKHLFVAFASGLRVHVHLGLIGQLDVHRGLDDVPAPQGAVRMRLVGEDPDGGWALGDLRGAITCAVLTPEQVEAVVRTQGPDPLRPGSDPDLAWQRIRRSRKAVGALLMDQKVLAGVGNVYRAELLFRHRTHPLRPGATLRSGQWEAMWTDLVALMHEGVRTGRIDTVRPEHTPEAMGREPRKDDHGGEVYVYRRTGQPCLVCGRPVRTEELEGRNSFWCARCQPTFRSRAVG
ncbi:MAG: DNA glycosylase [Nocardioides sp.]|nr:DNA glycosylase [Nocardioides sp.]